MIIYSHVAFASASTQPQQTYWNFFQGMRWNMWLTDGNGWISSCSSTFKAACLEVLVFLACILVTSANPNINKSLSERRIFRPPRDKTSVESFQLYVWCVEGSLGRYQGRVKLINFAECSSKWGGGVPPIRENKCFFGIKEKFSEWS